MASMSVIYPRATNDLASPEATAEAQGRARRVRVWCEISMTFTVLLAAFTGLWFLWQIMHTVT